MFDLVFSLCLEKFLLLVHVLRSSFIAIVARRSLSLRSILHLGHSPDADELHSHGSEVTLLSMLR